MNRSFNLRQNGLALVLALLLFGIFSVVLPAFAGDSSTSTFGAIVLPTPKTPPQLNRCVEPTAIMRRNHMKFLLRQRDQTVINGIRGQKYSLSGCMDCHNPTVAGQEVVHYDNPDHFCASCHRYASVKIDCFECHADHGTKLIKQSRLADEGVEQINGLSASTFASNHLCMESQSINLNLLPGDES